MTEGMAIMESDWTVETSRVAGMILVDLGIGTSASLEPGSDSRRDMVAARIQLYIDELKQDTAAEIRRLRAVEAEQAARIAARDARITALEAGLRPFADAAVSIAASLSGWDDDDAVLAEWEPWEGPDAKLTFGHFREAARLINPPQEGR